MTKILNVEFPKLICVNSSECVSTERHYLILETRTRPPDSGFI
jgi:hypothetical protein